MRRLEGKVNFLGVDSYPIKVLAAACHCVKSRQYAQFWQVNRWLDWELRVLNFYFFCMCMYRIDDTIKITKRLMSLMFNRILLFILILGIIQHQFNLTSAKAKVSINIISIYIYEPNRQRYSFEIAFGVWTSMKSQRIIDKVWDIHDFKFLFSQFIECNTLKFWVNWDWKFYFSTFYGVKSNCNPPLFLGGGLRKTFTM